MSTENSKAIVRRYFDEVWNQGNLAAVDDLVASNYVRHNDSVPGGKRSGSDVLKRIVASERATFPDLTQTIEDIVAEADQVVVRLTSRGTMRGELLGRAPTGNQFTIPAIHVIRLAANSIEEEWLTVNVIGILSQLSLTPSLQQLLQPASD